MYTNLHPPTPKVRKTEELLLIEINKGYIVVNQKKNLDAIGGKKIKEACICKYSILYNTNKDHFTPKIVPTTEINLEY